MYVTAKSILKDDNDCADAIQNAIVKAFMKRHSLKNEAYAKTWLIRIVINECYSILRSSRKIVSLEECKELNDTYAEDKKDYGELYAAVRHLKEDLRMVVVLYYIEEFSCKEIAAILGISESVPITETSGKSQSQDERRTHITGGSKHMREDRE